MFTGPTHLTSLWSCWRRQLATQ